ncbi:MAG TPA: peptide chain release factor N(5)-glutamine methyltransferase [Vicinamibacterales bacterium]|nr:peptide chain release factor N(5)-glutamine methyltransferase [Vicinamibacterales bacterium]
MTLHTRILEARDRLVRAGLAPAEADFDARLLARHVLGWDAARLLTEQREPEPPDFAARYDAIVARRAGREPVAYITGVREFWGLPFAVSPDVLIPRPDTELLVEEAVTELRDSSAWGSPERAVIVDVGTGSGCVAISLAREMPGAFVVATDVSPAALQVARRNAGRLVPENPPRFVRADMLSGLRLLADVIVSNPPYVREGDAPGLTPEVRDREPSPALFGGTDGLVLIRRLLEQAPSRLRPGGRLLFEFGCGQDDAVEELISADGRYTIIGIRRDLQGIPRAAVLRVDGR